MRAFDELRKKIGGGDLFATVEIKLHGRAGNGPTINFYLPSSEHHVGVANLQFGGDVSVLPAFADRVRAYQEFGEAVRALLLAEAGE